MSPTLIRCLADVKEEVRKDKRIKRCDRKGNEEEGCKKEKDICDEG